MGWDWSKICVRELKQNHLRRKSEPFAVLGLAWAAKAAAATDSPKAMVWIWLVQQTSKTKSDTVAVSNEALATYGVSRKAKTMALRQLEEAGLIAVERRCGKAPLVRLLP
jgi:DNA-binding transcriptional ArsR family regulator